MPEKRRGDPPFFCAPRRRSGVPSDRRRATVGSHPDRPPLHIDAAPPWGRIPTDRRCISTPCPRGRVASQSTAATSPTFDIGMTPNAEGVGFALGHAATARGPAEGGRSGCDPTGHHGSSGRRRATVGSHPDRPPLHIDAAPPWGRIPTDHRCFSTPCHRGRVASQSTAATSPTFDIGMTTNAVGLGSVAGQAATAWWTG